MLSDAGLWTAVEPAFLAKDAYVCAATYAPIRHDDDFFTWNPSLDEPLLHAIADAILGALCEGDVGVHFPDNDPQWSGANSLELLSRVMWLARERSLHVVNVDSTILLEKPKLRAYVNSMRENIAAVLGIDAGCVSVKAKTGEGVDAVGQGLAVTAQAAVLMESN